VAAPRGRQITNFGNLFDPFAVGSATVSVAPPAPSRPIIKRDERRRIERLQREDEEIIILES